MNSLNTWCASASVNDPSGSPGKERLRLRESSGTTNGERAAYEVGETIGTARIEPDSEDGSSSRMNRTTAAIAGYSQPCTPAIRHSLGPSRGPVASNTGHSRWRSLGAFDVATRRVTIGGV